MEEKLKHMLQLQDTLNKKINEDWKDIRTEDDFIRAAWIECAELVDSLPWKWWKKQTPDMDNVKIEVVDIWHFLLSLILQKTTNIEEATKSHLMTYFKQGLEMNLQNLNIDPVHIHHYLGETDQYKRLIYTAERIVENLLRKNLQEAMFFFGLLVKDVMSFEELYYLYVGKNILNHIRQEKGYKTGNYKKTINGLEDNHYLLQIVKDVNSVEELEEKIRNRFKQLREE